MVRRIAQESRTGQIMLPPGLATAPVLDLMCTHFVLTLTQQQGAQFNLKRDLSGLLPLCGRHLVWPVTVLHRLRRWLGQRAPAFEAWVGHEQLPNREFLDRFAIWRGPYDEATLFFTWTTMPARPPRT